MDYLAVFVISAVTLALELILVRVFSIGHWHHFSYLVISTALLGFGAGGTIISIWSDFFQSKYRIIHWFSALCMAISVPLTFFISQKVPLEELRLIWDFRQTFYLGAYYLLFFINFFFAGNFIALFFTVMGAKAYKIYFFNMAGSGGGAALAVAAMFGNSPAKLLICASAILFLCAIMLAVRLNWKLTVLSVLSGFITIYMFSSLGPLNLKIAISENKSLTYYQALPEAEILATKYSPMARVDFIKAPVIRHFPGLSISFTGMLPEQILILSDADAVSPVNHFEKVSDLACYDHITSALAYHLIDDPEVCVIGAGGGSDVGQALLLGSKKITAVEMNSQIINYVKKELHEFSSGIYSLAKVPIIITEGRNFLQRTAPKYDIITISLLDSYSASAAGLYALNESHLYTVEAMEQALNKLTPQGVLSITRFLDMPPRDSLKMFATLAQTLRHRQILHPAAHLIMIRSLATVTLLASPSEFNAAQLQKVRIFCQSRGFDLVHMEGLTEDQANQYHILEDPLYFRSCQKLLSQDYKNFYENYAYDIRPATDNRPYYFDFFKWRTLPYLIKALPGQWMVFSEWGYLVLVITLLQAVLAGLVFILLPLAVAKPIKSIPSGKMGLILYFSLLGLCYMFMEMAFVQHLTLLIGHPVYGVSVTLVGFLLFSGIGALVCGNYLKKRSSINIIPKAISFIIIVGFLDLLILNYGFDWLIGYSRLIKIMLVLMFISPLAFFMGIPFPSALKLMHSRAHAVAVWGWSINGYASVFGTVLGSLISISLGFTALFFIALIGYFLAILALKLW